MFRCNTFNKIAVTFSSIMVALSTSTALSTDVHRGRSEVFRTYNTAAYNKCGFHIIVHYINRPNSSQTLKAILQTRPTSDTSIVSPSGEFRIFFDTTGVNEPALFETNGQQIPHSAFAFADSAAKIADHVYEVEVDSMGFPPAPGTDSAAGAGQYYIYIQSLPTGEYGETDADYSHPIIERTNPTYRAWTVIRNEFQSTYTKGVAAMKVTIAHEYNHGIQLGNYGLWPNDLWFYELTSTWMEQVVYPQVKDYYQYLPVFYENVSLPFNEYDPYSYAGYERCVFGIFVQHEYPDVDVMKLIWQNMSHEPVLPATQDAFRSIGVNPAYAFQLFTEWNYLTGYRAPLASQYGYTTYPLAAAYPLARIAGEGNLSATGVDFYESALPLSEHFYQVNDGPDTIGIAVVNTDFSSAEAGDTLNSQYGVGISTNATNCMKQLSGGYCMFLDVPSYTNWAMVPFIFGDALSPTNNVPFPQPFNPDGGTLRIPYPFHDAVGATLLVYGISGQLVDKQSGDNYVQVYLRGKYFVWNGRSSTGKAVSTGVYIYVLSDGSNSIVGKIAVVKN